MNKLLTNEHPLILLPRLASTIGLNETIFLQQLYYWLQRSKHVHEGHKWVSNSYESWQKQFPFWSTFTIQEIVMGLETSNYIQAENDHTLITDQTKWYRIKYDVLSEICNLAAPITQDLEDKSEQLSLFKM